MQVEFAALAIDECTTRVDVAPADTALILGVAEPQRRNPDLSQRQQDWIDAIASVSGRPFHPLSRVVPAGHASTFLGLIHARELLASGAVSACIVGGVDSYLNTFDMQRLVRERRLLGPNVSRGLIPGEGAAFVNVGLRTALAGPDYLGRDMVIMGLGVAVEQADRCVDGDRYPDGRGLERALTAAIADSGMPESSINLRISDMNGEQYRCDDTLLAQVRFYKTYRHHLEIWHPAECIGDVGAASGAISLILALTSMSRGYAPSPIAMCESASDGGHRAGCVIMHSSAMHSP